MSQERWWNYQDDDSTFRIAAADLNIIPYGYYFGFIPVLGTGMNLYLTQVGSGETKVDQSLVTSPEIGLWKTKQGVIIQENDVVGPLPISTGHSTFPRIDLIIGEHEYIQAIGGQTALYKVIQGTPANNPVPPTLTAGSENKQVILGQIYIPATTTNLNGAGVVYTQPLQPNFLGDDTNVHTNRPNTFTSVQNMPQISRKWGVCYLSGGIIDLTKDSTGTALTGAALEENLGSNCFIVDQVNFSNTDVTNVLPYSHDFIRMEKCLDFYTLSPLTLVVGNFTDGTNKSIKIKANSGFTIQTIEDALLDGFYTGIWTVRYGGEAKLHDTNKFTAVNSWNKTTIGSLSGAGLLIAGSGGNFVEVALSPSNNILNGIAPISGSGTILAVKATTELMTLTHNDGSSNKPLWIPSQSTLKSTSLEETFLFVEDTTHWRLVGTYSESDTWHQVGAANGLGTSFTSEYTTPSGNEVIFKKVSPNMVALNGIVNLVAPTTPPTTNVAFTLPLGYRPMRDFSTIVAVRTTSIATGLALATVTARINVTIFGEVAIIPIEAWETVLGEPYTLGVMNIQLVFPL